MADEMNLHELNDKYDALWAQFIARPGEERSKAFDEEYTGQSDACILHHRLVALRKEMEPLERDFEADLRELFQEELIQARDSTGFYDQENDNNKAVELYSALTNVEWRHENGTRYSISFRGAGGLIAEIRECGDYLDWYCSGLEGCISDEIAEDLAIKGWTGTPI